MLKRLTLVGFLALCAAQSDDATNPALRGQVVAEKALVWPPVDAKGVPLCRMPGQTPCGDGAGTCTLLFCECTGMKNCKWYDPPHKSPKPVVDATAAAATPAAPETAAPTDPDTDPRFGPIPGAATTDAATPPATAADAAAPAAGAVTKDPPTVGTVGAVANVAAPAAPGGKTNAAAPKKAGTTA